MAMSEVDFLNRMVTETGASGTVDINTTGATSKTVSIPIPFKPSKLYIYRIPKGGYQVDAVYDKDVSENTQVVTEYTNAVYTHQHSLPSSDALCIQSISDTEFTFNINNANYSGTYRWIIIK